MDEVTVSVWKKENYKIPGGNWSLIFKTTGDDGYFGSIDRINQWAEKYEFTESGTYFISVEGMSFNTSQGTIVEVIVPKYDKTVTRPSSISIV